MDKINELKQLITAQEEQAAKLDHSDTSGTYYKDIYELLSVAYFAAKDILVLQEGNVPIVEDEASKVALHNAEDALAEAKKVITEQQDKLVKVLQIVS